MSPIMTDGPMLEAPNKGIDEFHVGRGESLGAAASEAFADNPTTQLFGMMQTDRAKGDEIDFGELGTGIPTPGMAEEKKAAQDTSRIDIIDANDRVKKAGLAPHLKLPDQPDIHPAQLEIMMNRAQARREREATIERGPQGFVQSALGVGTSFAVGAIDPLNLASAFIPVMGELRYAKLLAGAGEGLGARAAVRAGVGAAEGAVGQAALEPLDWYSHTQDGRDFGMADVLHNVLFGAVLGGALHTGGGAVSDIYRARKERPMYPYDLGEPLESHTPYEEVRAGRQPPPIPRDILGAFPGVHVRGDNLAEDGITPQALETHFNEAVHGIEPHDAASHEPIFPESPGDAHVTSAALTLEHRAALPDLPSAAVQTIDDLPQRAREDAARAGIANLIDGEPLRVGEMLEIAAQTDSRIAESFDAWHGSPHDFERFDLSKIGTGEGAQAYGHGLYFAENERVARGYQRTVSDKAFVNKVAELYDEGHSPSDAWAEIKDHWKEFSPGEQRLMTALEKDDWLGFDYPHQAVSAALRDIKSFDVSEETKAAVRAIGNMYQVKIKADLDHFIDWDKPFDEQSEHVKRSLRENQDPSISGLTHKWGHDMKALYGRLSQRLGEHVDEQGERWGAAGPSIASKTLHEAGIRGIKYLDQGSRIRAFGDAAEVRIGQIEEALQESPSSGSAADNARVSKLQRELEDLRGPGTRNFVVFNDKDIEITHKNGEPVNREQFLEERTAEREIAVKPKAARGRAAADPNTWSLFEMLAHEGGLRPDPELETIFGNRKGPFVPGFGALVRPNGRTLDDALRVAKDHGYLFDAADVTGAEARLTPGDLLDRLAEQNAGRRQYRMDQSIEAKFDHEREIHEIISALHHEIEASTGQKGVHVDPQLENRVVEIIRREGEHDVLAAYERAIMEDAERFEGLSRERQNHPETAAIPGWDHPDAGGASRHGEADPGERGQAGLSGEEARGQDGGQSRGGGDGDRGSVPNALGARLDQDAAWRRLAASTPDFDEPAAIAASNAASDVKPPPTKLDERLTAAQKADAYAKQMYDMFAERLPEGDRQRLDDLIKTIDDDHQAREIAIKQGGACLFGARD